MGAKSWTLVFSSGDVPETLRKVPSIDADGTRAFVESLHPDATITSTDAQTCIDGLNPPEDVVYAHLSPEVRILCTNEAGIDYPSKLDPRFIEASKPGRLLLHAQHSVVDWFAFAIWENGVLKRALSLSPDSGVLENIGEPLRFEGPFWAGEHAEDLEDYPFDFHPLDMAEECLRTQVGFVQEGMPGSDDVDPEQVEMLEFRLARESGLRRLIKRLWN
jgi:hypothetical protein